MNKDSKFERFNVVEEANEIDDCLLKNRIKKFFIDVIAAQEVLMGCDYRLYLKPFTWDTYYQFIKTCASLCQLNYSFMRIYPSFSHCIRFIKKHYSKFIK